MMRDEKLVRVAVKSKQSVERVVWVWGAILESASEINDHGRYDFDASEAAYFLRCDESELLDILTAMGILGRVSDGIVVKWADRQFDSDQSKDRQKRYRERLKSSGERNSDVTPPSPDARVTPQETETETETETERTSVRVGGALMSKDDFEGIVWTVFPQNPNSSRAKAWSAFNALSKADQLSCASGANHVSLAFDEAKTDEPIEQRLKFHQHLSNWISDRGWEAVLA